MNTVSKSAPSSSPNPAPNPAANDSTATTTNLVDAAAAQGSFKTFGKAISAAGLVDTLKGPGPFTVFAPTDAAFAKLPTGKLEALFKPDNKNELISILNYHVAPGRVSLAEMAKLNEAKTVQGQSAKIRVTGDQVKLDDAILSTLDIAASNGMLHAIDTVNMPKA